MMSPWDALATQVLNAFRTMHYSFIIERQTKLQVLTESSACEKKRSSRTCQEWILCHSFDEGDGKYIDFPFHSTYSISHSPCNQSTQRRWKPYRCWVSSSPVKAASCGACKGDVNHHRWTHHQGVGTKLIHLTANGKFSQNRTLKGVLTCLGM